MSGDGRTRLTLELAAANIGRGVVYCPAFGPKEDGTITGVSETTVFVLYVGDRYAKGTYPSDLEFLS